MAETLNWRLDYVLLLGGSSETISETTAVSELVRLTVVPNEGEAEILCGMLRAAGIPCAYRGTDLAAGQAGYGFSFGGWREIFVDNGDLARARALLPIEK